MILDLSLNLIKEKNLRQHYLRMEQYLKKFIVQKGTDKKPITHTSMEGGKWHIPKSELPKFSTESVKTSSFQFAIST